MRVGQKGTLTRVWAETDRRAPERAPVGRLPVGLSLRRRVPEPGPRLRADPAALRYDGNDPVPGRAERPRRAGGTRHPGARWRRLAHGQGPALARPCHAAAAARLQPRAEPARAGLGVPAAALLG